MKKMIFALSSVAVAAVLTLAACKKDDKGNGNNNNSNNFDRAAMLTNYADNYIVPAYDNMVQRAEDLKAKADAFAANADVQNLTALQSSWRDAYLAWQRTSMLQFGPAENVSLRMFTNTYPATVSKIESNISSGSYNLDQFGNTDATGFPALDYLLNGLANDNTAIVAAYTTGANAAARKQYVQDIAAQILNKVKQVRDEWKGGYRDTYVSSTGTDVNSSLSQTVNAFVLYYERYLRSGKIGLPVGAMTGTAAPQLTEAYYSPDLSKQLAVTALNSVKDFYEGRSFDGSTQGSSMKTYLAAIGTKDDDGKLMAEVVTEEMLEALTKLQTLNSDIRNGVQTNRQEILALYDELQQIVPLLKVDMVSAFSISITYTDNDGD